MLFFFHDIGIPLWLPPLFLVSVVTCPVLCIMAIRYLLYKQIKTSTAVLSALAIFLLAVAFLAFNIGSIYQIEFLAFMTAPFGSAAAIVLVIENAPMDLTYGIGLLINFLSVFGLVRFIEKRFE